MQFLDNLFIMKIALWVISLGSEAYLFYYQITSVFLRSNTEPYFNKKKKKYMYKQALPDTLQ